MDWEAISSILGERHDRPLILLDRDGLLRMCNSAMERVFGFSRFEAEGTPWARLCTPTEHRERAERVIVEALRGSLLVTELHGLTKRGERLVLEVEFAVVGAAPRQGLLMTVARYRPFSPTSKSSTFAAGAEVDLMIITAPPQHGEIVMLTVDGTRIPTQSGAYCFAYLFRRDTPCPECPAHPGDEPWPRVRVRANPQVASRSHPEFEVRTATRVDHATARIQLRGVGATTLEAIQAAKVAELCARGGLSEREREVLALLLRGDSLDDVAARTGISVRTVKFHQTNILEKLGADSRADLMRLLL